MALGVSRRVGANLVAFIAFGVGIIMLAIVTFASGLLFSNAYATSVTIPDAGGVLPRQEVTVMGRAVGTVAGAELVEGGVRLTFDVQPQFTVPERADVRILRRSPIGEQAIELTPVPAEGWAPAERGAEIEVAEAVEPTTVQELLENTVALFEQVSPENTATIIRELAIAFDGRTDIIRELNDASLDVGPAGRPGRVPAPAGHRRATDGRTRRPCGRPRRPVRRRRGPRRGPLREPSQHGGAPAGRPEPAGPGRGVGRQRASRRPVPRRRPDLGERDAARPVHGRRSPTTLLRLQAGRGPDGDRQAPALLPARPW